MIPDIPRAATTIPQSIQTSQQQDEGSLHLMAAVLPSCTNSPNFCAPTSCRVDGILADECRDSFVTGLTPTGDQQQTSIPPSICATESSLDPMKATLSAGVSCDKSCPLTHTTYSWRASNTFSRPACSFVPNPVTDLSTHPHTLGSVTFPRDATMVIVCPMKALEEETVSHADISTS